MSNVRRKNGTARDKVRRRVLREESVCHLCDQVVDVTLAARLPGSPEVDEIVPVTFGGSPIDRANCRLAHRWCNRKRWHRPVAAGRAEILADPPRFAADGSLLVADLEPVTSRAW